MRIIVTADFQAAWSNLDLCEQAWNEILDHAQEKRVTAIVVAGDLKRDYNPIDTRVIIWWQRAIARAKALGIAVIIDLGNHDRNSQTSDIKNWFPILRKAGAICVDKKEEEIYVRGGQLMLLPFCTNKNELRERAKRLAKRVVNPEKAVLIFHEDISGCSYNQLGRESVAGVLPTELNPDRFSFVVGGHIHLHQQIGENIFYAGSPFASDWGEANQRKGYVFISDSGLEFLPSKIPGWFDPTWPNFYEPTSWEGARVRVHCRCRSGVDYVHKFASARSRAEEKYAGAEIYVSADFSEAETSTDVKIRFDDPDADKIKAYVKETCPENIDPKEAIELLVDRVESVSGKTVRSGTGVTFTRAIAKDFLSFKELDLDWKQQGIIVVQGVNRDRMGKSNGAGKTSALQTIPVSLFGATFKGQKHDHWARRNAEGEASVELRLRDSKGRKIQIIRTRKPTGLRLLVDGKDESTGMKPQEKEATQGEIEKLTGFTWQTLANAVYIDQEVARTFLSGSKSARTAVLSRFQNLERFEKALKRVTTERKSVEEDLVKIDRRLVIRTERLKGLEQQLAIMADESNDRIRVAKKEMNTRKALVNEFPHERMKAAETKAGTAFTRAEAALEESRKADWAVDIWKDKVKLADKQKEELENALSLKECPTCRQTVDKQIIQSLMKDLEAATVNVNGSYRDAIRNCQEKNIAAKEAEGQSDELQGKFVRYEKELIMLRLAFDEAEKRYIELFKVEDRGTEGRKQCLNSITDTKKRLKGLDDTRKSTVREIEFYKYCERSLSRDGIPAFLNALLCPTLNGAAEYYAELFGDKAVQVRFEIENGDFVPKILNATGGEEIDDQSSGEKALAGLIASFALREAAPKCNVLILDEPGDGLDPSAARQFAVALKTLKKKFDGIWITTHNQAILAELSGEQMLEVSKKRGVSSIQ